jgi:hypothetical protein
LKRVEHAVPVATRLRLRLHGLALEERPCHLGRTGRKQSNLFAFGHRAFRLLVTCPYCVGTAGNQERAVRIVETGDGGRLKSISAERY